jgi:predicted nucleic acid-binding protein
MDAFIAATAEGHGPTPVTRNVTDFETLGLQLINPWQNDQT